MEQGQQRALIAYAMQKENINLRELSEFIEEDYEKMKKYYQEYCFFGEKIFKKLCLIGKVSKNGFEFEKLDENWGRKLGGKNRYKSKS